MKIDKGSKFNPLLTIEYMISNPENKYFDCKSAKIKPSDLAKTISAFANAEGGTIVIGISDNPRLLEGINFFGEEKINCFLSAPQEYCKPMPQYDEEFLDIINEKGDPDRLLLLHIKVSIDQIIRTSNDSTFLRIGDKSRELKGEILRDLEYSKGTRHFEDELNEDAKIDDLDGDLIKRYKEILNAEKISTEQMLESRGFIKNRNGKKLLTNAAVLLFAKNVTKFYPNCRVRFIRYEGEKAQSGLSLNISKDVNFEEPIIRLIDKSKQFISTQLRDFTALDSLTGKFKVVPEYPEFAWQEGLINAITHREYGMQGDYILVAMYDNRLEIQSPGKLPHLVTISNIKDTRFSRNPRIARVLTEFGWVRELNEGVKRIYTDMENFFLEAPEYSEPEQKVKLILKNNIVMRILRKRDSVQRSIGIKIWDELDKLEQSIIYYIANRGRATRADLEKFTNKSGSTVTKRLNKLIDKGVLQRNGNKTDPQQTYELIFV